MALDPARFSALKAELQTDPAALGYAQPLNEGAFSTVAALLNGNAAPEFWVWRTRVTKDELVNGAGPDGTTFNWTGAGFITRSVGERDAWRELFQTDGRGGAWVNPSLANVRQAFTDIFSGATAPAPANRTHIAAVCRRRALRVERIFATGTGSTASPGLLTHEGPVTADEVIAAWRS